ncbi:MAG: maleylpyruvate isomerase family mycothiol-dependent enzyme [Chloroflexi bacterium]|uniref:maleylpyruvate isomerase family mycothiol-dependent enzyme n=1 Tax=Candidatus Flexifilum breve TaxID=3140694 RepID=UPI003135BBDB|nr:maleylpyruvate isomerase family mycothiol-dependent enzyme [Chloroflexota bacterium]
MTRVSQFTDYSAAQPAAAIPKLAPPEVIPLARVELERFLALVETLTPADLNQPTDCTLWSVKDIIAHQASHVFGLTRFGEFMDQFNPLRARAYTARGMNGLDAANQRQIDLRAQWSLAQLIAEMRDHREASFAGRQRFPALLRRVTIPVPGSNLRVSLGDLIDNIYTRDMWMHRADICRATGREMVQTADHDGRIVALVVRELDRTLNASLNGQSVLYRLTGPAGGAWLVGGNNPPEATITMDGLEFNRLASGRVSAQQVLDQGLAQIEGRRELAESALRQTVVLY